MRPSSVRHEVLRVGHDGAETRADELVAEEPLEIWVRGPGSPPERLVVTMRSPGHDDELAVGFLRSEGLVWGADEVERVEVEPLRNRVTVELKVPVDLSSSTRRFVVNSSCGLCGKGSIEQVERDAPVIRRAGKLPRSVLLSLPGSLRASQAMFSATGGAHAAGLFSLDGGLELVREDVGRHNAVDKVVGRVVLGDLDPSPTALLVSGRASFELVQKAAMAGVPFLCAISAPSSLAAQAAVRLGVTLVGFLRGSSFNVYAHPEGVDETA